MRLFWSQKVQWRGTGEESKCGRRKEEEAALVDPQLVEASWWTWSFENGDALILLNRRKSFLHSESDQSTWLSLHCGCFGLCLTWFLWEKTWRTFVWHMEISMVQDKIAFKKQEVMSQEVGSDSGRSWGGPQRWGFEAVLSQSQLLTPGAADIKTKEIGKLITACSRSFSLNYKVSFDISGYFYHFFLDTALLNAFDFHAYSQVFQIRPSFTET